MRPRELHLHTSNRIESLAARLVEVSLQQPLTNLLEQETVMTLNPGMARWLRFDIAESLGVSLGWDFPFPGKFFQRIFSGFDSRHAPFGLFDEHTARWELFDLLANLEDAPAFSLLRRYCEPGGSRRLQLASKLAWLFDQYLLYRPDAITDWESGRDAQNWQAEIWRRLRDRLFPDSNRPAHIARIWRDLRASQPSQVKPDTTGWPSRISVFGVSSLPPLYLDILEAVSLFRPVHLYLLQPTDLYWADLKSTKQIARASQRKKAATTQSDLNFDDSSFDLGNPLLPSFGKQGQAFLDLILDKDPIHDDSAFVPPDSQTQLGCLQSDLFQIENRGTSDAPQYPFPPYDGSIQIHRCASARREVESLWDYLVDYFCQTPGSSAADVLVMAPDIQLYAGHIESVFTQPEEEGSTIPYSIADQTGPQESTFVSGAIAFLELSKKRATALELIELVQHPITQNAFGFTEQDLERIEIWIRETGVVWGWDRSHRARFSAFPTDRNTWSEFRTRLSAGLAFRNHESLLPGNVSPFCEIEGESAELAGRFLEFLALLEDLYHDANRTESIAYWNQRLCSFVDRLRPSEEIELNRFFSSVEAIQEALPDQSKVLANGQEAIQCAVSALENTAPASGYLSGRVTFCSLKPMRSIPAKVVCLLGMDHDTFPRKSIRPPFDLLAQTPRRGDRNTRDEDKQFFLETLLSARDRLFISYQAFSPVSEVEREPSIVVAELIDYLNQADPETEPAQRIVTHKRQSYDPEYFSGDSLFTYSQERAENCRSFLERSASATRIHQEPRRLTDEPCSEDNADIPVDSLISFFKDPQKYFVTNSIGARFTDPAEAPLESDLLGEDPLDRYDLASRFAEAMQDNRPLDFLDPSLLAALKLLPPGHLERLYYENLKAQAQLVENLRTRITPTIQPDLMSVDIATPFGRISGSLMRGNAGDRQFFLLPGKWKAKHMIDFWIRHLLGNAVVPYESVIHSLQEPNKAVTFPPLTEVETILETLCRLFRSGAKQPLPFFPQLSWDALEKQDRQSTEFDEPVFLAESRSLFARDADNRQYQSRLPWDAYAQACFGEAPVIDSYYAEVSLAIWSPCRDALNAKKASK